MMEKEYLKKQGPQFSRIKRLKINRKNRRKPLPSTHVMRLILNRKKPLNLAVHLQL